MAAFIFDIGNVLIHFDFQALMESISGESTLGVKEIKEIWNGPELIAVEAGKIDDKQHLETLSEKTGISWTYEDWIQAWMDVYAINETGLGLLRELREKSYPVYILSNLAKYNSEAINRKFPDFFRQANENFFSFKLGCCKPDAEIYRKVCERISQPFHECVFLDDAQANVDGAVAVGMRGFVYHNDRIKFIKDQIHQIAS